MKTFLNSKQVELGNVITVDIDCYTRAIELQVVGGTFGTVTKYFLVDDEGKVNDAGYFENIPDMINAMRITEIKIPRFHLARREKKELEQVEDFKIGDALLCHIGGEVAWRKIVGNDNCIFTIDPDTGERKSKTTYRTANDLAHEYDIAYIYTNMPF